MKINIERTRARSKHSSNSKIHVSAKVNAVFNPLKQKGGFKILEKPFYFNGMFSCLLVLLVFTFMAMGCDKLRNSKEQEYYQLTFA
ncbi:MAG: hypothetical protein LBE13_00945, partial [Bacteroidales bacterium]|nr:hypothetical protein [Bacteroidales bacterium]